MIGLTDETLEAIQARQKKERRGETSTGLYQDTLTMKEYHLTPSTWGGLSRIDKKILHYARIMESHYMDTHENRAKEEAEKERKQQAFLDTLPKTVTRRR